MTHQEAQRFVDRFNYVERIKEALPNIWLKPIRWASADDSVFIEFNIGFTSRNRKIEWSGVDRFELKGDRALYGVAYFDTLPIWAEADPSMKRGHIMDAFGEETN